MWKWRRRLCLPLEENQSRDVQLTGFLFISLQVSPKGTKETKEE